MKRELVCARGLSILVQKEYAYRNLDFTVYENELLGVCQLSYLKKTSWIKQLFGPDTKISGEVWLDGRPLDLHKKKISPEIYYISEVSMLIDSLSIADNLFAVQEFGRFKLRYNERAAQRAAQAFLEELQLPLDLNTPISSLSKSMVHLLQVAKAILLKAKIIVLDNITDDYSVKEYDRLLSLISRYKQGRAFVFFSNRENRLTRQADRIYILRNHRLAGQMFHEEYTSSLFFHMLHGGKGRPVLDRESTVRKDLVFHTHFAGILKEPLDFSVHGGEIVGILDLYGSYTSAFLTYFLSCFPYVIAGKRCRNYQEAVKNGLAAISLSESEAPIFPDFTLNENLTFQILPRISRGLVINRRVQRYCGQKYLQEIITRKQDGEVLAFSRIRLLMYKWLLSRPKLLVLDNLTTGMDHEDKKRFRSMVDQAAAEGTACVILTSYPEDCLDICDKIWIIQEDSYSRLQDRRCVQRKKEGTEGFSDYLKSPMPEDLY